MSMQPNPKKTTCQKCGKEFMGEFTTLGFALGWHKFCSKCRKNNENKD